MVFSGITAGIKKDFKELKDKVQKIDMTEVKQKVQKDFSNLKDKVSQMVVSLKKGENISLKKVDPHMTKIIVGLGWNINSAQEQDFDLDASLILLANNGKVRKEQDFIFYGNLRSQGEAVIHRGDNQTGYNAGDAEQIMIELDKLDSDVSKLIIPVSIYDAPKRHQNFGMVSTAYIRILNADTQTEVIKYDLTEDYSKETALIFAEIYRHDNEWKIKAIGQGFHDGLEGIGRNYGLSLSDDK